MHMAFANVSQEASIWLNMGLRYLLSPVNLPPGAGLLGPAPAMAPRPPQAGTPNGGHGAESSCKEPPRRPLRTQATEKVAERENSVQMPKIQNWHPLPLEKWPANWRNHLEGTKKGKIAWTYWTLGHDLQKDAPESGQQKDGRQLRSSFLRKLFKDLGLPPGTHTFWPPTLPGGPMDPVAEREIFWSGLSHLGSRAAIIFGSEAAKHLLPEESLRASLNLRKYGQLIWVLWDIDALAASPAKYSMLHNFLRAALSPFYR